MKLTSRTPKRAERYQPSSDAERAAELDARNHENGIDYSIRRVEHLLARKRAAAQHQDHLRLAYVDRHASVDYRGPVHC